MEESSEVATEAEPLIFRVSLTEEEIVAARRYHDRVLFRRPFRWLTRPMLLGFALGGVALAGYLATISS